MITSWTDEEDKANNKYDSTRGKSKNNTGGNNNNYSGSNRKCKPDNTVVAIQHHAEENSKKTSSGFKDFLKEKCSLHLDGNHTTEQCYQLWRALKDLQSHDILTTRRPRRKLTKATTTSRNLTRR
jgi:hypothetical protein